MTLPLEKQVCSRELAEKLNEYGVPQESYFQWLNGILTTYDIREVARFENNAHSTKNTFYSAFTVAELGEMLPHFAHSWNTGTEWIASWKPTGHPSFIATSEADARAKMLLYLLQNKLITL